MCLCVCVLFFVLLTNVVSVLVVAEVAVRPCIDIRVREYGSRGAEAFHTTIYTSCLKFLLHKRCVGELYSAVSLFESDWERKSHIFHAQPIRAGAIDSRRKYLFGRLASFSSYI